MNNSPEELLELFRTRLSELSAEYIGCDSLEEAGRKLIALLVAEDWDCGVIGNGVSDKVRETCLDFMEQLNVDNHETVSRGWLDSAAKAKVGITQIEAIIADTGTLVVPSRVPGDRIATLIPPVHIALIFGAVIYGTLADYLESADRKLTHQFITGPSRTADIEKQLVVGIHGPVRLIVLGPS